MHTAATTSQAALTASPRLSATIANATAPRRATAIHQSLVCGALVLLIVLMDVLPHCRKPNQTEVTLAGDLDRGKSVWPGSFLSVHTRVRTGYFISLGSELIG